MDYDVQKLKKTQEEILEYVDRVCEENDIHYSLYFGTLLGAVRHGGYIPWDDDVDIACERIDYEKLVEILTANESCEPKFFVQSVSSDPQSPVLHTKIRMNGTECAEKNVVSEEQHKGIFIDIFPLDYYENTFKHNLIAKLIRVLYSFRGSVLFGKKPSGLRVVVNMLSSRISVEKYNKWINRLFASLNKKQSDTLTCYICRYEAGRCSVKKEWLKPYEKIKFEDKYFYAPNQCDKVLKSLYGENYLILPPKSERITHEYQRVVWFNE